MRDERLKNDQVFGVLDGEAAAALGAAESLVDCDDLLFQVDDPEFRNLEVENLILGYRDVAPTIADHNPLKPLNEYGAEKVRAKLGMLTGAF